MKSKNKEFIKFLDTLIERKEKLIIERNGNTPHDFDMLARYLAVKAHYEEENK